MNDKLDVKTLKEIRKRWDEQHFQNLKGISNIFDHEVFQHMLSIAPALDKTDVAYKVYCFQEAGCQVTKVCHFYGISEGYYRQLRIINRDEWKQRHLTDMEEKFNAEIKIWSKTKDYTEDLEEYMNYIWAYADLFCVGYKESDYFTLLSPVQNTHIAEQCDTNLSLASSNSNNLPMI